MTLTDTQALILSHASQRESGSLYPLPTTLTHKPAAARSIAAMAKRGWVEEREGATTAEQARTEDDLRYGVYVTAAGLAAIGVEPEPTEAPSPAPLVGVAATPAPSPVDKVAPRATKSALVLGLLLRAEGATLAELVAATGWLPHSTRAALTGLRKKGHALDRSKRDGATCYRVAGSAR